MGNTNIYSLSGILSDNLEKVSRATLLVTVRDDDWTVTLAKFDNWP